MYIIWSPIEKNAKYVQKTKAVLYGNFLVSTSLILWFLIIMVVNLLVNLIIYNSLLVFIIFAQNF